MKTTALILAGSALLVATLLATAAGCIALAVDYLLDWCDAS